MDENYLHLYNSLYINLAKKIQLSRIVYFYINFYLFVTKLLILRTNFLIKRPHYFIPTYVKQNVLMFSKEQRTTNYPHNICLKHDQHPNVNMSTHALTFQ